MPDAGELTGSEAERIPGSQSLPEQGAGQRMGAAERNAGEPAEAHARRDRGRLEMARGNKARDKRAPVRPGTEVIDPSLKDESQLGVALLHALRNAGVSVLYQDNELRTVWARNMAAPWMTGADGDTVLTPAQMERIVDARRRAIATGRADRFEISTSGENDTRWFEIWVDPDYADDGTVRGVITTKVETTERKHREQSLRALLREVSHRSRNLLAIIQSIASQTGHYSANIQEFLRYFQGRLQSLAASQDLITFSNWRGALLRDLVVGQLDRHGERDLMRLRFEGANPYLTPNAALHIGLAVHELIVSSREGGALSRSPGVIQISSRLTATEDDKRTLHLTWSEPFPDAGAHFGGRNFSVLTLSRVVPTSLDGAA